MTNLSRFVRQNASHPKSRRMTILMLFLLILTPSFVLGQMIYFIETNPSLTSMGTVECLDSIYADTVWASSQPAHGNRGSILGPPDYNGGLIDPSPYIVDFNGTVSIGFSRPIIDGPGVDLRIIGAQLDEAEGFSIFAGPSLTNMAYIGFFPGSPQGTLNPNSPLVIGIDFNGIVIPPNSSILRMVSENSSGNSPFGFDYDAVCLIEHTLASEQNSWGEISSNAYPNPTNGKIKFQTPPMTTEQTHISILNSKGETILEKETRAATEGSNTILLDLSNLPPGPYIAKITNGSVQISKKIFRF